MFENGGKYSAKPQSAAPCRAGGIKERQPAIAQHTLRRVFGLLRQGDQEGIAFNQHYLCDGAVLLKHACALGCEGVVSKRLGSPYRSGRVDDWLKVKNPAAPAVRCEAEEDWDGRRRGR